MILDHLDFCIMPGEFVGLIGPNGAGKSSLLRCLYRKITDYSGDLLFQNHPLQSYTRNQLAREIAVVLQEPPGQFELSVADVIAMGLTPLKKLFEFDSEQDRQRIAAAAEQVDLADKLEQNFNSLSGGEKQRAMIARAIVQNPKILIMDEPTNHLDIRHQVEVLKLARSLRITVVVSIHDLNLAATFCDRFILMDRGKIVAMGDHQQVLTEHHLSEVFGVEARIDQHPFHSTPRITFDMHLAEPTLNSDLKERC
jgi:iron complex transport system ATP-binding protein